MNLNFITKLCTPSLIYLILGLIVTFSSAKNVSGTITSIIIVLVITYLLDYVCKTYGQTTSWYIFVIIYLLPFIFIIITFFIMIFISNKRSSNMVISLKKFTPTKMANTIFSDFKK